MEARSSRPSLQFTAVARTLTQPSSVVRVGRYSERDTPFPDNAGNNNISSPTSTSPVGFKSKVVSRRHCEFWCTKGQWYVKDVKSSSGTFLNHVRLSSPGVESRPFPVNDGDVVQLGIDFKGGEEVIFRCVKIRVECNRGWQKSLNSFNTEAHKRLLQSAAGATGAASPSINHAAARANARSIDDTASTHSSECSICLNPVAPCQALFVAPCSHVWHYKCIRNLIRGPEFLCPNCRLMTDLDADVEAPEEWENDFSEADHNQMLGDGDGDEDLPLGVRGGVEGQSRGARGVDERMEAMALDLDTVGGAEESQLARSQRSQPMDIPRRVINAQLDDDELAESMAHTSITPRSRARNQHQRQILHTSTTETEAEAEVEIDATQLNCRPGTRSRSIWERFLTTRKHRLTAVTNSADELEGAEEADLLSPRSATPTSSAQFALAAGVMDLGRSSSSRRVTQK